MTWIKTISTALFPYRRIIEALRRWLASFGPILARAYSTDYGVRMR